MQPLAIKCTKRWLEGNQLLRRHRRRRTVVGLGAQLTAEHQYRFTRETLMHLVDRDTVVVVIQNLKGPTRSLIDCRNTLEDLEDCESSNTQDRRPRGSRRNNIANTFDQELN